MIINGDKTEFMAFCSPDVEKQPITFRLKHGIVNVTHCKEYTYLGAIFTSDGLLKSSLERHAAQREKDLNKLTIFLQRNTNAPYMVKKAVVDACFNASLLYGCEAWLGIKPDRSLKSMYIKAIKMLLGVRRSTPNEAVLIESGYPDFEALVRSRQKRFFEKMGGRTDVMNDPLMFTLSLTHREKPIVSRYINGVMEEVDVLASDLRVRREKVQLSSRTKLMAYRIMNPNLSVHPLYESTDSLGDDYLRITFSRFRLSSHKLKIETERWTCIPQENRLYQCGETRQTERHVLCDCPLVNYIRLSYGYETVDLDEFINNASNAKGNLRFLSESITYKCCNYF